MPDMLVTTEFRHRGEDVKPGDIIDATDSEASFIALANLAELANGEPSADVDEVDVVTFLAEYATKRVELEHKYLRVKGFLNV